MAGIHYTACLSFISEPFHGAFPDSPVVRTLCCHCQGPGSIPAQKTNQNQQMLPVLCNRSALTALKRLRISHINFFFLSQVHYGVCMIHIKKVLPFFSFSPCHEACGILVPQPGIEPGWQ